MDIAFINTTEYIIISSYQVKSCYEDVLIEVLTSIMIRALHRNTW